MSDLIQSYPRIARRALVAVSLATLPSPAFAAPGDPGPWLAYLAFVAAAIFVVVMLLREALSEPSDELPADPSRARDRSSMRRYEAGSDAKRRSRPA